MTKITKVFMGLSLAGFVAGCLIDFSGKAVDPKWTVVMPLGAVFFGLFLIFLMLQKEMAAFDREEMEKYRMVEQTVDSSPRQAKPGTGDQGLKR